MIIRTCSEELIKEAIRLGADEARCEGNKLIVMWKGGGATMQPKMPSDADDG
jgi:hypothetical protein